MYYINPSMSTIENIGGGDLTVEETEDADMWRVINESYDEPQEHTYLVASDDDATHVVFCQCPHHKHRDATCKHMKAVQAAINRGVFEQDNGQDTDLPEKLERYLNAGGITTEEAAGIASNQF
jgi:predicted nucleic acid-binding Zn finger protein